MNLIKVFILFFILQTPIAWAQQSNVKPQAIENSAAPSAVNPGKDLNQQSAPKKERTEQILIDPFSGSASTANIDPNTNPDIANFVDQTLVGIIVGETKRIAVLQSAQGQINRFKKNEKINLEYKILEIYKDKILIASLDNNEYEVYFNNVIKPVERKKATSKKPVKLEQQLKNSPDSSLDSLVPKLDPKKQKPSKKIAEPMPAKKEEPEIKKEDVVRPEIDEEELKQIKMIQEDGNLNNSEMEKISDIDLEKIKEKLKK